MYQLDIVEDFLILRRLEAAWIYSNLIFRAIGLKVSIAKFIFT